MYPPFCERREVASQDCADSAECARARGRERANERLRRTRREGGRGKGGRKRRGDRFYCARMQAEESLGVQCTCSCYIELRVCGAPPSLAAVVARRRRRRRAPGLSQLFYSLLRHHQYCATTIAPTPPFHPSIRFFHLSTAGGAANSTSPQLQLHTRAMTNSTLLFLRSASLPLPGFLRKLFPTSCAESTR